MENFESTTPERKRSKYKDPANYKFNCACGRNFSLQASFKTHRRKYHNEPKSTLVYNHEKNCSMCDFSANSRDEMIQHFQSMHHISIVEEKHIFNNKEEFLSWKKNIESNTVSKFIAKGTRKASKGSISYFYCHRSGRYIPKGKGLRSLKTQGSVKTNSFCPAVMVQKCSNDGTCTVEFTTTHVGHENELKYISLTQEERKELAKKIAEKIPFDEILNQFRDSIFETSLERKHLLTRKDLHNIAATYNLKPNAVKYKDTTVSLDVWVKKLEKEAKYILFHKPQGVCLENYPRLKQEDFILIITTDAQLDVLKKYGNECICLDGTFGLTRHDFQLQTIIVLDGSREAFPCAFLISNGSSMALFELFFMKIKDQLGETLKPKVFMSDVSDTFYNAWFNVMEIPEKRQYCTWHVDRAWRRNLSKIKSQDTQVLIYKHLRALLTERDPNTFHIMLEDFCCISETECVTFIKYFKDCFASNYEYWAYCYRDPDGINSNIHFERMHQSIKSIYSKGRSENRLDKGISAIIRFVKDKLISENSGNKEKVCSNILNIRTRHCNMEKMGPTQLTSSDDGWEVLPENGLEVFLVQKQETTCNNCQLVCSDCDTCIHQFQCSCIDSAINYNMCKHIHLVAKSIKDINLSSSIGSDGDTNDYLDSLNSGLDNCATIVYELIEEKPSQEDMDERKRQLGNAFQETLNAVSSIEEIQAIEETLSELRLSLANIRKKAIPVFQLRLSTVPKINIIAQNKVTFT